MPMNINTDTAEEMKQIPSIGDKFAQLIQFREVYGVVKRESLNLALRGNLSSDVLDLIKFSLPRTDDPFAIDLNCLPPVPKTDSWEPLMTASRRSWSPSKTKTDDRQSLTLALSRSRSRSPAEL